MPIQAALVADDGTAEPVALEPEHEGGSSVHGYTKYYSFSVPVHHAVTYTALEVESGAASPTSFPLQNDIFVVPSETAADGPKVDFTVAVRTAASRPPRVDITISAPVRQQGTLAPKVARREVADAKPGGALSVPGYQLWEGSVDLGAPPTGAVAVVASAGLEGGVVRDVLYLSAGVAGW